MTQLIEFETDRLRLRQWRPDDRAPFAALTSDARVMAYFPSPLTTAQSNQMIDKCEALINERGWGFWAAELKASQELIGFVGLHIPSDQFPLSPCVEIGWRLAFEHWGKGLATEAATGALNVGFDLLGLEEIVAFTAQGNARSRAVMARLGMKESCEFQHPQIQEDHPLRAHCLYRLSHAMHKATPN